MLERGRVERNGRVLEFGTLGDLLLDPVDEHRIVGRLSLDVRIE